MSGGGKKFTNTSEKDPSKVVGESSLSTGGTRAARAARATRAKKEQNSNSNNDSKSLNGTINGVKEVINDIKGNSSKTVSKEEYDKLTEKYNALAKELDTFKQENNTFYILNKDLQARLSESYDAHDAVQKQYNDLNKLFEEYKSKQSQETTKTTSEPNVEESQVDTTAQTEEPKVTSSENAEEVKTDNSAKTEETVTPEPEVKAEGEPKVKAEQEQANQESTKELDGSTGTRTGTGKVAKSNMMTPAEAFSYFKNKDNYGNASLYFKDSALDGYIDSSSGKWIPRGYFDAFSARDNIDPKKFTFEHFKAKIPNDLGKKLNAEEATKKRIADAKALEDYEKEYENYNTGFKAYLRKHPKLANTLKLGLLAGAFDGGYTFGKWLNDTYIAGQNDKDEIQNIVDRLNDDDPEPLVGNTNNNSPENIAAQLKGADESTETPEGDSGTIEQAIAEQAPAGNAEPENPQVAANAATPTNTKANNAPTSTAESAPTQGLPPVVTRNTPSTNPDSSGMTYSQRVEAEGQAPKAGSMAYNSNNPDMVTANLINAMNQNPQAGSDAIGYGDLYDQNFIDFWAKRNPNLAFGVSQGRR